MFQDNLIPIETPQKEEDLIPIETLREEEKPSDITNEAGRISVLDEEGHPWFCFEIHTHKKIDETTLKDFVDMLLKPFLDSHPGTKIVGEIIEVHKEEGELPELLKNLLSSILR